MMRHLLAVLVALCTCAMLVTPASAATIDTTDWRWASPDIQKVKPNFLCPSKACHKKAKKIAKLKFKLKVLKYKNRREREWHKWTTAYIPDCTWRGESGEAGAEFAPFRYVMANGMGSAAFGKYQFMPGTYFTFGKYDDWTPLDQEIASKKAYWAQGTSPWEACH